MLVEKVFELSSAKFELLFRKQLGRQAKKSPLLWAFQKVESCIEKFFQKNFKKGLTNAPLVCIIVIVRWSQAADGDKRQSLWGYSSAGRASALQAEGHRFEPCRSHLCRRGGTGRRAGLKILWWQHRTGSIPVAGIYGSLEPGRKDKSFK